MSTDEPPPPSMATRKQPCTLQRRSPGKGGSSPSKHGGATGESGKSPEAGPNNCQRLTEYPENSTAENVSGRRIPPKLTLNSRTVRWDEQTGRALSGFENPPDSLINP